jgi:hypothetical protein
MAGMISRRIETLRCAFNDMLVAAAAAADWIEIENICFSSNNSSNRKITTE